MTLPRPSRRYELLGGGGLFLVAFIITLLAGSGLASAYALAYRGRVYPGVRAGVIHLGGLSAPELTGVLENFNNRVAREGITLQWRNREGQEQRFTVYPVTAPDSTAELFRVESEAAEVAALSVGRQGTLVQQLFTPILFRFFSVPLALPTVVNAASLPGLLERELARFSPPPRNARLAITSLTPYSYTVESEQSGTVFKVEKIIAALANQLGSLSREPLMVEPSVVAPVIREEDVLAVAGKVPELLRSGELRLGYLDPETGERREWVLAPERLASFIAVEPGPEGEPALTLAPDRLTAWLKAEVAPVVERLAQDAKFTVKDTKVEEFQGSRSGVRLRLAETGAAIQTAWAERRSGGETPTALVPVALELVPPRVTTPAVNSLGIAEMLGVGQSSFKGSPPNRIKNIITAAKRLNGILIKPGEEFSANAYLGPYTRETGYLPELVIKGRQIKPEIGGGLCQFGSTLFRMAMNSGMPVTERRNHSLVVHYYADPVNGNPGTDATLYDPAPDFKFLNDTGHYLLVQTAVDLKKQTLAFALWGTPDGRRQGWFTPPVVQRWIASGRPQEIEVSDGSLKPGQRKCQHAYRGAVASFTYSRVMPSGEKIDRVFESFYRPLPEICLVGVESAPGSGAALPAAELGEPVGP